VVDAFSTGLIDVCDGQALDMEFMLRSDVKADEYFMMIERKTARLLETSVAIGASIGGSDHSQRSALQRFAREIGLAFQMQDDILDVYGSEKFGKARGGDIIEGKRTWLMLECCDRAENSPRATERDRQITSMFRAGQPLAAEHVDEVIAMLDRYGVMEDATSIVERYTHSAYEALISLPAGASRDRLHDLAASLMERTH
jgi:geranylgeranyl diphosphate synthase type II